MVNFFSLNVVEIAQILASGAVVGALVYAALTYRKGKRLDQIKLANEILNNLNSQTAQIPQLGEKKGDSYITARNQWVENYFNTWEWYCFLVNHKQINYKPIKDYLKPSLIHDYKEFFEKYATDEEKQNNEKYKEFKDLYKELTHKRHS
jgi:hypothetical protein